MKQIDYCKAGETPAWEVAQVYLDCVRMHYVLEANRHEGWIIILKYDKFYYDAPLQERIVGTVDIRVPEQHDISKQKKYDVVIGVREDDHHKRLYSFTRYKTDGVLGSMVDAVIDE